MTDSSSSLHHSNTAASSAGELTPASPVSPIGVAAGMSPQPHHATNDPSATLLRSGSGSSSSSSHTHSHSHSHSHTTSNDITSKQDEASRIYNSALSLSSARSSSRSYFLNQLLVICGGCNASDAIEILSISFILPNATDDLHLTDSQKGWLAGMIFAGMMLGGWCWGSLSDRYGRKPCLLACLLINSFGGMLSALSPELYTLLICRFLSGIGVGGSVPVVFTYYSEFLSIRDRGSYMVAIACCWMIGSIFTASVAWIIIPMKWEWYSDVLKGDIHSWRLFAVVCGLPSLMCALLLLRAPESPRWLLSRGRVKEAQQVLVRVYEANWEGSMTTESGEESSGNGRRSHSNSNGSAENNGNNSSSIDIDSSSSSSLRQDTDLLNNDDDFDSSPRPPCMQRWCGLWYRRSVMTRRGREWKEKSGAGGRRRRSNGSVGGGGETEPAGNGAPTLASSSDLPSPSSTHQQSSSSSHSSRTGSGGVHYTKLEVASGVGDETNSNGGVHVTAAPVSHDSDSMLDGDSSSSTHASSSSTVASSSTSTTIHLTPHYESLSEPTRWILFLRELDRFPLLSGLKNSALSDSNTKAASNARRVRNQATAARAVVGIQPETPQAQEESRPVLLETNGTRSDDMEDGSGEIDPSSSSSTISSTSSSSFLTTILASLQPIFSTTLSLFTLSHLRSNSIKLFLIWFFLAFGYYGLTLWIPSYFTSKDHSDDNNSDKNPDSHTNTNIYVTSLIGSLSALPTNLLSIYTVRMYGRVKTLVVSLLLSGICILLIPAIHVEWGAILMLCAFSGISTPAWNALNISTTELYPTEIRATAFGFFAAMGRIGAVLGNVMFGDFIGTSPVIPIFVTGCTLVLAAIASALLPETKHINLV